MKTFLLALLQCVGVGCACVAAGFPIVYAMSLVGIPPNYNFIYDWAPGMFFFFAGYWAMRVSGKYLRARGRELHLSRINLYRAFGISITFTFVIAFIAKTNPGKQWWPSIWVFAITTAFLWLFFSLLDTASALVSYWNKSKRFS